MAEHGPSKPHRSPGSAVAWVDEAGELTTTSGPFGRILEGPVSDAAAREAILVIGNSTGDVVAATTTGTRWQIRVPGPVLRHPVLDGDRAYIAYGTHDGRHGGLQALDLETGEVVWNSTSIQAQRTTCARPAHHRCRLQCASLRS